MTLRIVRLPGVTAPAEWPSYTVPGAISLSDDFTGPAASLLGRQSDAGKGGGSFTWIGTEGSNALRTTGNGLAISGTPGNHFLGVKLGGANYEFRAKIDALPVGFNLYLDARRAAVATSAGYRAQITPTGEVSLVFRDAALVATTLFTAPTPIGAGSTVGIRTRGALISLVINGVVVGTVTNSSLPGPGYTGIATVSTMTAVTIDWIEIREW